MKTNDAVFYKAIAAFLLAATLGVSARADSSSVTSPVIGPELLTNSQMEAPGSWESRDSGTSAGPKLEYSTADKHGGNSSLYVQIARNPGEYPELRSGRFATETGRTYRVSYWMKVTNGGVGTTRRNGADNDQRTLNAPILNSPEWTYYCTDYTEVKGGAGAYISFYPAHARATFYLDDVSIREITTTPGSVRDAWKAKFPGRDFVCWQKNSPWQNLQALTYPAANVKECSQIPLAVGRSEYESASFVVTNLSDRELKLTVSKASGKIGLTVRHGLWVTPKNGNLVNDALPLLDAPLVIPPAESREIWLTLQTQNTPAGNYVSKLVLTSSSGTKRSVDINTRVYPVTLPKDMPIYTTYWDNVVPTWVKTPGLAKEQMLDLKAHYTNVAIGHPWIVPPLRVDKSGKFSPDYSELDAALENYKTLKPKMIVFNWNRDAYFVGDSRNNANEFGKQPVYMSEEWKAVFAVWLRDWVAHLKAKGYGYDRFAMYPDDETLNPEVAKIARLIKETDPNVLFYVDSMGQNLSEAQALAPYVDIYSPLLYDYLNIAPFEADPRKIEVNKLLKKKLQYFWTYANPPHHEPQESSGYADYRLAVWRAWKAGMKGFGYFIYSYKTHWNSYNLEDWPTWSVVYFAAAEDAPAGLSKKELVVPGKRWEGTREGVEDFVYLEMLKKAVAAPRIGASSQAVAEGRKVLAEWPNKVIAAPGNEGLADVGKERILQVLSKLN